jgi:gliding motility-associated-like protein
VIPEIVDYEFRRLTVVNRWGDIVYESREYNNDWGGTYKGNLLPQGTYYYILELENGPEDRKIYRSHITIIR